MTDLRWPRFNFPVETEKHRKYLYSSRYNSLIALDDSLYASLLFLSRDNGMSILSAFSEEEIEYLKKIYALVEDDDALVDILHHQSMSRLYSKKTMVLTIAPTQSCNFACTYCFEKWRQSGALSNRTEDAIINYIKHLKQEDGLESVNLTWYGGEPLLQYKRIGQPMVGGKGSSRNAVTDIFLDLFTQYGGVSEESYPDDVNMECMTRSPYSMLIGSQGEIYKCYEDRGNKELTVGNINAPKVWRNYELIAKYAVGIDHYNDPECRKCFICLYAGAVASFVVSRMYMKENITIVAHRSKAA